MSIVGWTEAHAKPALEEACQQLSLDASKAELMTLSWNANYRIIETPYVLRVHRPIKDQQSYRKRVTGEIACAVRLQESLVPSIRIASEVAPEPLQTEAGLVTVWYWVDKVKESPLDFFKVGALLKQFHQATVGLEGAVELNEWSSDPKAATQTFLSLVLPKSELNLPESVVTEFSDRIYRAHSNLQSELGVGVIHGDYHQDNLISTADGLVICDLEGVQVGPRDYDLVPIAYAVRHSEVPEQAYDQFSAGYGFDLYKNVDIDNYLLVRECAVFEFYALKMEQDPSYKSALIARLSSILSLN